MQRQRGEEGGLTPELVCSCFRAMAYALDGHALAAVPYQMEWSAWDEAYQEAFMHAMQRAFGLVLEAEGTQWGTIAANIYLEFRRALGDEYPEDFGQLPQSTRLAWEVIARHLVNMLGGFDPSEDGSMEEHESRWLEWTQNKISRLALPELVQEELRDQDEFDAERPAGENKAGS